MKYFLLCHCKQKSFWSWHPIYSRQSFM